MSHSMVLAVHIWNLWQEEKDSMWLVCYCQKPSGRIFCCFCHHRSKWGSRPRTKSAHQLPQWQHAVQCRWQPDCDWTKQTTSHRFVNVYHRPQILLQVTVFMSYSWERGHFTCMWVKCWLSNLDCAVRTDALISVTCQHVSTSEH